LVLGYSDVAKILRKPDQDQIGDLEMFSTVGHNQPACIQQTILDELTRQYRSSHDNLFWSSDKRFAEQEITRRLELLKNQGKDQQHDDELFELELYGIVKELISKPREELFDHEALLLPYVATGSSTWEAFESCSRQLGFDGEFPYEAGRRKQNPEFTQLLKFISRRVSEFKHYKIDERPEETFVTIEENILNVRNEIEQLRNVTISSLEHLEQTAKQSQEVTDYLIKGQEGQEGKNQTITDQIYRVQVSIDGIYNQIQKIESQSSLQKLFLYSLFTVSLVTMLYILLS
jgi:hypothetical protein